MDAAKRVIKNTGFLYSRMAITIFISLYTTRLVLAALGSSEFGIFTLVAGSTAMLTFLNTAMASATQRFMSHAQGAGDLDKLKRIFNISVLLHIIVGILVFILLELVGFFLFNGVLDIPSDKIFAAKLLFQFAIFSTVFTIISVPYDAVINANENMLLVAIIGIIESFLKLGIALYITYSSGEILITYGFLMACLPVLLLIINRIYCHLNYPECTINFKKYYDQPLFFEMSNFGGWSFLGSITGVINNHGQGLIINIFFGTVINAAQGVANQISGQIGAFSNVMIKALNPVIVKSEGGGKKDRMNRSIMTGSKLSFFLLAFFAIPAIIEMPYILHLWLKDVPDFAVIFCRLILVRNLINQLFVTLAVGISAVGKIRNYQISISLLALFPLITSYFLFSIGYPPYILYVVFILTILIRSFGITLYFVKKHIEGLIVSIFLQNVVLRCVFVAFLVLLYGCLLNFFLNEGIIRLILNIIGGSIVFILAVYLLGFNRNEKEQIQNILSSLFVKYRISSIFK